MIRAIAATVVALGFAGAALAHDHDRWDRHDRDYREWRGDRHDRGWRYEERPRYYAAPRWQYRYRAPEPRGWHPGWREPYGRGYRYWNDSYYYVVPSEPSFGVSLVLPLR